MLLPIRRNPSLDRVPRYNPRLAEEILRRVEEIKQRIEEIRANRPWEK